MSIMRNTIPASIAIAQGPDVDKRKDRAPRINVEQFVVNALQFKARKGCTVEEMVGEYLGLASENNKTKNPAEKAITARVKELKESGAAVAKGDRIYWYRYAK